MSAIDNFFDEVNFDIKTGNKFLTQKLLYLAQKDVEAMRSEIDALHRLLDLRDEQYFKWCESGIIETEKECPG